MVWTKRYLIKRGRKVKEIRTQKKQKKKKRKEKQIPTESESTMENFRIIVLGDIGVGKSTFLKLITENFEQIYPINAFDYFTFSDEIIEKKEKYNICKNEMMNTQIKNFDSNHNNNNNIKNKTKSNNNNNRRSNSCSSSYSSSWSSSNSTSSNSSNSKSNTSNSNTSNNIYNDDMEQMMEDMCLNAKRNFLYFIENRMGTDFTATENKTKHTYGCQVYTFLWVRTNDVLYDSQIKFPLNIIKTNEGINKQTCNNCVNNYIDDKNYKAIIIEFCEIGGSQTYSYIRNIFYRDYDGIMLVYDSTNGKSYHNLVNWLYELYIRRKNPSDAFCAVKNKKKGIWSFLQKIKRSYMLLSNNDYKKNRKYKYDEYNNKNKNNYGDDCFFNIASDIEKGIYKNNDDILKGEIPIACVSTKIDMINSKTKPKDITPEYPGLLSRYFFGNLSHESSYEEEKDIQEKKTILKQLQQHISRANEIKASSIDCVVDIDNFFKFLNSVYERKYK